MRTDLDVATTHDLSLSFPGDCPHSGRKLFLPPAAHDVMEVTSMSAGPADYFFHESQWPDMEGRIKLARKVNAVLQCSCYTQHHVYMRFAALRRRKHFPGRPAPITNVRRAEDEETETRAAQSVSVVAKLDVLLEEEPSPDPEIATLWADVLAEGVLPEDILTYALLRQVKKHMESQNVHDRASTQIGSAPGAPKRRERHPQKRIKQPQVAPPASSFCHGGISESSGQEGGGESPRELESEPSSPSSTAVLNLPVEAQKLATQIRHALSAPIAPNPKTFSDLRAWIRGSGCATML